MITLDSRPAPAAATAWPGRAVVWLRLSVTAALLAAAGNIYALFDLEGVYGRETSAFVDQAMAQDAVDLVVVSPAIAVLAFLALRGSLRAYLTWLGAVAFTTYNYVVYTLSVHVGPLFLVWVAVLGLSAFSLIGGLAALDARAVAAWFGQTSRRPAGWSLIRSAAPPRTAMAPYDRARPAGLPRADRATDHGHALRRAGPRRRTRMGGASTDRGDHHRLPRRPGPPDADAWAEGPPTGWLWPAAFPYVRMICLRAWRSACESRLD